MLSGRLLRRTAIVTVSALLGGTLAGAVVAAPAAAAGERLTLAKSAAPAVLPGEDISYTLRAANPGTAPEYNIAFRDELPVGVSYRPGSTTPTGAGEPTVLTVGSGATAHQILLWENVADLQVGGSYSLSFDVRTDPAVLPAGATVSNGATVYANTDPRIAPGFSSTGAAEEYTESAASSPAVTAISPIEIRKSEPSSEGELLRGLHTQSTVYTLRVRNSGAGATHGVQVVDYLPATLEFLGCGALDNTANGAVEYPGAPRLTVTAAVPGCVLPDRVETVVDPVASPSLPAGVYTKLTWDLGDLAAGATVTLPYRAGVPLRENTATFAGGAPSGPTAQAANLDNNTGPSTREGATERSATNRAIVTGRYQGPYLGSPGNTPVSASDEATRSLEDLALAKSVSPTTFVEGDIATYTLTIRGSQYTSASDVVLTDLVPDGLCPLDDTGNHSPDLAPECSAGTPPAISGSPTTSIGFASVSHTADEYVVRFTPFVVPADGVVTVTYRARMRATYAASANPTTAGDEYTNRVSLAGDTAPVAGTGESGTRPVTDSSSATITSSGPRIDKTVLPATTTPYRCDADGYAQSDDLTVAETTFRPGDRICFTLRVDFPATTTTRNPVVTDFLPRGTRYEAGSMALTDDNTVPAGQVLFDESGTVAGNNPTWVLGQSSGGGHYVAKGAVFEVRLAVVVTAAAPARSREIRGNLMKLRGESSGGTTYSLRDREDVRIAPTPEVGITKGVANVNGGPGNGPDVDDVTVREGDVVTFRVDLTNRGVAANGTNVPVHDVVVWDVLPAGIACAQISAISDGGTCRAPGVLPVADATRSTVSWPALTTPLAAGATRTLTYAMTVPVGTGVSANLVNTAAVRSFQGDGNTGGPGGTVTYYPASNVDTTVPSASQTAPAASDPSNVRLPATTPSKTQTTSITETRNDTTTQATIGEIVTYTVSIRVPAHTTVYRGVLSDPMPTGFTLLTVAGTQSLDGGATTGPLTASGFTATASGSTATLTFPTTYQNTTAQDHVFGMVVTARVSTLAGNVHNIARPNTVSFRSTTTAAGGTNLPARTASTTTTVVVPAPLLGKTSDVASATAGQTVTYTLTANNTTGRPPTHDTVVIDCVPTGLSFQAYGPLSQGTTSPAVPGDGTNGCASGTTRLQWNVGSLQPAAPQTLRYTVVVDPAAAGSASYVNTATLTGSTLADGVNDCSPSTIERCVSTSASATVTVAPVAIGKTTSTPTRAIGERARFTVTATVPARINYYRAALVDVLPAGLDPASIVTESVTCSPSCTVPGTRLADAADPSGVTLVGWSLGDLTAVPAARTVTVTYTAVVRDIPTNSRGTALTNAASVRWHTTPGLPPTGAGDAFDKTTGPASAVVTVVEPHVQLRKSVDPDDPAPGQRFTYTVTVENAGAASLSTAWGVTVVDTVPTGVVVDLATISDGGQLTGAGPNGGGTITWQLPQLAPQAERELTYRAELAASPTLTAAALVNSVDATYDSLAGGTGRHYDDVTPATAAVTPAFPHVVAAKTAVTSGPAYVGEDFVWRLTLRNDGASTAHDVDATDLLPPNWLYMPGSARVVVAGGPEAQVEPVVGGAPATGHTLAWADLGDLAPGQSVVITLTTRPAAAALVDPGAGAAFAHTNTVRPHAEDATGADHNAAGPYYGPDATAVARIHAADVAIAKSPDGPFVAGAGGSWTLQVTNRGPDTAVGPFVVTDQLPAGVSFVSATGTGWSCSYTAGDRTIRCLRSGADTLAAGGSFPAVTVRVGIAPDVAAGTTYTNTAHVTARTYDPQPSNNDDQDTVAVTTSADLVLAKQVSGAVVAGRDATFTIDVTNRGPSDALAPVRVVDTLPAGTTFVSATGTGWSCAASGPAGAQTLECTRGLLAAGAVAPQLTVVVAVPSGRTGAIVNSATVSSPTTDPIPSNNTDEVTRTPDTVADLALTKSHVGTLTAGETGTYRLRVDNNGPSDAAGPLTLTDTLPAEVAFVAVASADGWSCAASAAGFECTRPAGLAAGTHTVLDVTVAVDADVTGNLHNVATVGSSTTDPDTSNNTDDDDSQTATSADLAIVKTADPDPVVAGRPLDYTLTVRNLGPSTARDVVVTDVLPAGLSYRSATGTGWTCDYADATRTVECARPTLAADTTAPTITVAVTVGSDAGPATLTNPANVAGSTPDPTPGNNHSEATVTIVDRADVSLHKTRVGTGPVTAGTTTSFRLTVRNAGPSDADDVLVRDTLPTGLLAQSATGDGWDCEVSDALVECRRPTVAADTDAPVITVTARVASWVPTGTTLVNTASVDTATPGDDPSDNTDSANVPVDTAADLSIGKTHRGGSVSAGDTVTYDLAVHNDGPSDAVAPVRVTDTLPSGLGYLSASAPWTCQVDDADPQQVDCELGDPLPAGADAPLLTMVVAVAADLPAGTYANTATVDSDTPDPTPGNNTDEDELDVDTLANLAITKTHNGPVRVGDPLVFDLQVSNTGPSQARDVTVTDTLPTGLEYESVTAAGWTCDYASGTRTLECGRATLDPGESSTLAVTVTVTADAYPGVRNNATVESVTPDSDPDDNTATDDVTVPALVNLAVSKTHEGTAVVGGTVRYAITVTNHGPTDDPGPVTVTDTLPLGLRAVSASGAGWECVTADRTVSCVRASGLAVAASAGLTVTAAVGPEAYPEVVNVATVTTPSEDTDPTDDTAVDPTPVTPVVDLGLAKELVGYDRGGAVATWRLTVSNAGPSATVTPVVVVDRLPTELTYRSARGPGWTCAAVAQLVTCTHPGSIAAGASSAVELRTTVAAEPGSTVTNVAEITAGGEGVGARARATLAVPPSGPLPQTGAELLTWLLLGAALVLSGTALLRPIRRRP